MLTSLVSWRWKLRGPFSVFPTVYAAETSETENTTEEEERRHAEEERRKEEEERRRRSWSWKLLKRQDARPIGEDDFVGMYDQEQLDKELEDEARIQAALGCPCMQPIRETSCAQEFVQAFECFMRSREEDRGADCMTYFLAVSRCVQEHPEEFSRDDDEGDVIGDAMAEAVQEASK